jgi:hypothetical protein
LLELLNKVWDLGLIEDRFSRGYAKTVVLSCFQRGYRAVGLAWSSGVVLNDRGSFPQGLPKLVKLVQLQMFL